MSTSNLRYDIELQTHASSDLDDKSAYFSTPYHHLHRQNANQTLKWFATDQPARLNRTATYSNDDITYDFNQHGYRCDKLQESPIVFVGCSYTFGVGLKLEEIWANKVAKALKIPYINLAYPGASAHYIQRTLTKTFSTLKPSLVIALIPYNYRFEFVSSDFSQPLKTWSKSGITSKSFNGKDKDRTYAYELFTTQAQEEFNLLSTLFTIQNFLKSNNCLFARGLWRYEQRPTANFLEALKSAEFGADWSNNIFDGHIRWTDLELKARDSTHPSAKFHEIYSQFVLEKIKCLNIV